MFTSVCTLAIIGTLTYIEHKGAPMHAANEVNSDVASEIQLNPISNASSQRTKTVQVIELSKEVREQCTREHANRNFWEGLDGTPKFLHREAKRKPHKMVSQSPDKGHRNPKQEHANQPKRSVTLSKRDRRLESRNSNFFETECSPRKRNAQDSSVVDI